MKENNDLTGAIPPQLIELESLKYLFLQGNPRLDKTVTPELKTFLEENGVDHGKHIPINNSHEVSILFSFDLPFSNIEQPFLF